MVEKSPAWWALIRRNTRNDGDYIEKEYLINGLRHGNRFRLGDNVRVKVARINAFRSEIDFELIER
jgi:exoribonuclease R